MEDEEVEKSDAISHSSELSANTKKMNEITNPQGGTFHKMLSSTCTDSSFEEMKKCLEQYKQEFYSNIYNGATIKFKSFKENFYKNLQILLYQVILIRDDKLREKKVSEVYSWFKKRLDFFNSLKSITSKTNTLDMKIEFDFEKKLKNEMYMAMNYPREFESKNRTLPDCLLKTT